MQSFISAPLLRLTTSKRLGVNRRRARASQTATAGGGHVKLLSAERLKEWLRTDLDVIILDVRGRVVKVGGRVESGLQRVEYVADDSAYFGGHIPGARFIDWRKVDTADHARLCDLCADCGVERAKPVVVYDWGGLVVRDAAVVRVGLHGVRGRRRAQRRVGQLGPVQRARLARYTVPPQVALRARYAARACRNSARNGDVRRDAQARRGASGRHGD